MKRSVLFASIVAYVLASNAFSGEIKINAFFDEPVPITLSSGIICNTADRVVEKMEHVVRGAEVPVFGCGMVEGDINGLKSVYGTFTIGGGSGTIFRFDVEGHDPFYITSGWKPWSAS